MKNIVNISYLITYSGRSRFIKEFRAGKIKNSRVYLTYLEKGNVGRTRKEEESELQTSNGTLGKIGKRKMNNGD